MVEGINTYGAGTAAPGVIQKTVPPPKREGGTATEDTKTKSDLDETNTDQAQALKNLLKATSDGDAEFVSRAETILNDALTMKSANTKLRIDIDDGTGMFVYSSIDKETGEVVSQFPAKEILAMIASYRETEGIVVDEKA